MVSTVNSFGVYGINGYMVSVECDISRGLPVFDIVGFPSNVVKESSDRVRAATKNCNFDFPLRRITINLAPADTKKEGAIYDLPIMLAILASAQTIPPVPKTCAFMGELSLDGKIRPARGVLSMAICAAKNGISEFFVPAENAAEAALARGVNIIAVETVYQVLEHLSGKRVIQPVPPKELENPGRPDYDFKEVRGQRHVKRALEIASAGGHNLLIIGPPGSGKSMLAKRLPSILPKLTYQQSLAVTQIHSVAGQTTKEHPFLTQPPFRSPHHTVSNVGLAGGGAVPRPGEISLAHNGVLFLDELPEFTKSALEVLRQPLEDGKISVTRASAAMEFPAEFMLICAMNPCKCGWHGYSGQRCNCTDKMVQTYVSKISGPLLDRIDIHVQANEVAFEEISQKQDEEASDVIRARVEVARQIQQQRFEGTQVHFNGKMSPAQTRNFCQLTAEGQMILKRAFEAMGFTGRSYDRVLRVARTIADLAKSEHISVEHVAEAIQFRTLDRNET